MSLEDRARDIVRTSVREERKSRKRRPEPRITNPDTHPRQFVNLTVAADFLGLDERTVKARIEQGDLEATQDGKVYRIAVSALVAYQARRRLAS